MHTAIAHTYEYTHSHTERDVSIYNTYNPHTSKSALSLPLIRRFVSFTFTFLMPSSSICIYTCVCVCSTSTLFSIIISNVISVRFDSFASVSTRINSTATAEAAATKKVIHVPNSHTHIYMRALTYVTSERAYTHTYRETDKALSYRIKPGTVKEME